MISVTIFHARPARPNAQPKTVHDVRVRWAAGRERWFDEVATVTPEELGGLDLLRAAFRQAERIGHGIRAPEAGDVFVAENIGAFAVVSRRKFVNIDGNVAGPDYLARIEIVR